MNSHVDVLFDGKPIFEPDHGAVVESEEIVRKVREVPEFQIPRESMSQPEVAMVPAYRLSRRQRDQVQLDLGVRASAAVSRLCRRFLPEGSRRDQKERRGEGREAANGHTVLCVEGKRRACPLESCASRINNLAREAYPFGNAVTWRVTRQLSAVSGQPSAVSLEAGTLEAGSWELEAESSRPDNR